MTLSSCIKCRDFIINIKRQTGSSAEIEVVFPDGDMTLYSSKIAAECSPSFSASVHEYVCLRSISILGFWVLIETSEKKCVPLKHFDKTSSGGYKLQR